MDGEWLLGARLLGKALCDQHHSYSLDALSVQIDGLWFKVQGLGGCTINH